MLVFKKTMTIHFLKIELYKLIRDAFNIKKRKNIDNEYNDIFNKRNRP